MCAQFPPDSYESHDAVFVDTSSVNVLAGIPVTSLDLVSTVLDLYEG